MLSNDKFIVHRMAEQKSKWTTAWAFQIFIV
jgi:hypothetical protein